jgi:hypothetical protein
MTSLSGSAFASTTAPVISADERTIYFGSTRTE